MHHFFPAVTHCSAPAKVQHASVNSTKTAVLSVVHIQCNSGFRLDGRASAICQINGKWSHLPTCVTGKAMKTSAIFISVFLYLVRPPCIHLASILHPPTSIPPSCSPNSLQEHCIRPPPSLLPALPTAFRSIASAHLHPSFLLSQQPSGALHPPTSIPPSCCPNTLQEHCIRPPPSLLPALPTAFRSIASAHLHPSFLLSQHPSGALHPPTYTYLSDTFLFFFTILSSLSSLHYPLFTILSSLSSLHYPLFTILSSLSSLHYPLITILSSLSSHHFPTAPHSTSTQFLVFCPVYTTVSSGRAMPEIL